MKPTDFAYMLSNYLSKYLSGQRNLSVNTIKAYRDSFMLLLMFLKERHNISPERVTIKTLDQTMIQEFLAWLAEERGNSLSTQNQRLAAIHAFFKYAQCENPELLFHCQKVMAIPFKKCPQPAVIHLSENELTSLLAMPDTRTQTGRRDMVLLSCLYDTAARVSEFTDLTCRDVRLDANPIVKLNGKNRKQRYIPLMSQTAALLKNYMEENDLFNINYIDAPLFCNRQNQKLSRAGVAYILKKYAHDADISSYENRITPHVLRHTKAMHLVRAGVNLIYIRDFLGHSQITTTEIYARADAEMKRAALEKVHSNAIPSNIPQWHTDKGLMSWLAGMCK